MLSTSLNNNPVTIQNSLAELSDSIQELDALFYNKSCPTNYVIHYLTPENPFHKIESMQLPVLKLSDLQGADLCSYYSNN